MYGQHVMNIAERKAATPGWRWRDIEKVEGGAIVRGGVPTRVMTRGPRKGETD